MMMRKRVVARVVAVAMVALGWGAAARAQGPGGPPHGPGFRPGPRLAEELGLSEEQRAQVEALHAKNRETLQPLMETAQAAREAFQQALEVEGAEPATVGRAALAMRAAEKKLRAAHEAVFEQMKSILTPEQRDTLDKLEKAHPGGFGPGPGRGPGPGHGHRPGPGGDRP
jgi:Spy/CpxP family protein refolding chaperone